MSTCEEFLCQHPEQFVLEGGGDGRRGVGSCSEKDPHPRCPPRAQAMFYIADTPKRVGIYLGRAGGFSCHNAACLRRSLPSHSRRRPPRAPLPQSHPCPVTAAGIGGYQLAFRLRIAASAHPAPPATNALDRKGRRVVIHSHAHPTHVSSQVIDPVRSHLPFVGSRIWKS